MHDLENNFAFIDSQNLYLSIKSQGWKIDFKKFRVYLKDKFKVTQAYLFMGYIKENQRMYEQLQKNGYTLVFKPTLIYKDGTTKGNCDAELVLHAMIKYPVFDKAVIVSGDGDFFCLAEYLRENDKLKSILIPDQNRYSALLKKINTPDRKFLFFLNPAQAKLGHS